MRTTTGSMLCWLLLYFLDCGWKPSVRPCGVRAVPIANVATPALGSAMLVACTFLFIASHVDMGDSWSPVAEPGATPARHAWPLSLGKASDVRDLSLRSIGTLLATLNWLIAWCVSGLVLVTFRRIEAEERILVDLFGAQYLEYRTRVSALSPWSCLGYD